jgi:hypothetical protein
MSHVLTFVLVDPNETGVERKVDELMDPYFSDSARREADKFDGCVIGGRYDGQMFGATPMYNLSPKEFRQRYGLDVVKPEGNVRVASEVPYGLIPFAVVAPGGEWFDQDDYEDRRSWAPKVEELPEAYREHLAVAVDCHC